MTDNGSATGWQTLQCAACAAARRRRTKGGTRVPAFWRWPAAWKGGADVARADRPHRCFPDAGGDRRRGAERTRAGASRRAAACCRLLRESSGDLGGSHAVHARRPVAAREGCGGEIRECSVRNARFSLVNNAELYDLAADPGKAKNVIARASGSRCGVARGL